MTRKSIDIVADEGADSRPGHGQQNLTALRNAVLAATRAVPRLDVEIPGSKAATTYEIADTWTADLAGGPLRLIGDAWVRRAPGWPMPSYYTPAGWLQGRHLAVLQNGPALTVDGIGFDGNGIAQAGGSNPHAGFVGDTLRLRNIHGTIDLTDVFTRNGRGLTTLSTAACPETFEMQMLRCTGTATIRRCHSWSNDGAPTASALALSYCDIEATFVDTISAFHRGQALTVYGGTQPLALDNVWLIRSGHGLNIEAGDRSGPTGAPVAVLARVDGRQSRIIGCKRGVVVNGTAGQRPAGLHAADLLIQGCDHAIAVTGTLPSAPLHFDRAFIDSPHLGAVEILAGGNNQAALDLIEFTDSTIHRDPAVPLVTPGNLRVPSGWSLTAV